MKANVKLKRALILRAEGFFSIIIRRLYAFGGALLLLLLLLLRGVRGVRGLFFFPPYPPSPSRFLFRWQLFLPIFCFWRQSGVPAETQFRKAWQSGREAAAIFCVHNFLRGAAFSLPFLVLRFAVLCASRQSKSDQFRARSADWPCDGGMVAPSAHVGRRKDKANTHRTDKKIGPG